MMRGACISAAALALVAAAPAHARDRHVTIAPYIELDQVLTADVQNGDVLTYTSVAAGVDASVQTRRTQVQISYQYQHHFAWKKGDADQDVHSGLARAAVEVAPGFSIEGGAIATRTRSDIRGDAPGILTGNQRNVTQVYSAYAGPTLATHAGPIGINAGYRYGYTKVESPGATGVAPGSPKLDAFDDARTQVAQVSAGVKSGTVLPVGVTVSGAWERDDAGELDQRYDGKYARGDVVLPVSGTVAVTGGAGYEKIKVSQRDPVVDGTGQPVTDSNGHFVTDKASPRRIAYQTDGLIWDAGVIWRPSPRTTLEARAGRRYGSMSYTGSLSYAMSKSVGLQIGVYDGIETFGRQLQDGLAALPTSFIAQRDAFGQQFNGCVYGTSGSAAGGCLNGVFQSISTASYRARGVDAVLSASRGPLSFGFGAGYANRHFYAPDSAPGTVVSGVEDQSYYGQFYVSRQLDRNSGITGDVFANYYNSGLADAPAIVSTGATGSYYRNFGHLSTTASVGIYSFHVDGAQSDTQAQGLLGARYTF